MQAIFSALLSAVLLYKYATLFVLAFAGGLIVPIPMSAILLAVGSFASQGYFGFTASLVAATAGNVLGDLTGYLLARRYGQAVVKKFNIERIRFFTQLETYVRERAGITVFITRFAGSLGPAANILSGLVRVPLMKFLPLDIIGNALEIAGLLLIGYIADGYWQTLSTSVSVIGDIFIVALIMIVVIMVYRRSSR